MKFFFAASLFVLLFSNELYAQEVTVYNTFDDLEKAVLADKNTTYVVNFWATWCAPCVKELPYFEQLNKENKNVKVILVSLDFKNQFETKLLPFLKKRNIASKVVFLADKNYNDWLSKVDESWSGAIPATWIIQADKKLFAERDFENFLELNEYVNSFINQNK